MFNFRFNFRMCTLSGVPVQDRRRQPEPGLGAQLHVRHQAVPLLRGHVVLTAHAWAADQFFVRLAGAATRCFGLLP